MQNQAAGGAKASKHGRGAEGGSSGKEDEMKAALASLEQNDLIVAREVGGESVYSITAKGVAEVESARRSPLLQLLM